MSPDFRTFLNLCRNSGESRYALFPPHQNQMELSIPGTPRKTSLILLLASYRGRIFQADVGAVGLDADAGSPTSLTVSTVVSK